MTVQGVSENREQVIAAIRRVSQTQNADFNYLLQQARIESGLNPDAKAGTSTALGLYQFTSGTWLGLVQRYGDQIGLGPQAQALRAGTASAADRASILALRTEPELATRLAAQFAADNAKALVGAGAQTIGATELYLAHFLGASGASAFLEGLRANPDGAAAAVLPQAARANVPIFYANGAPRSFQAIYDRFAEKFAGVGSVAGALGAAGGMALLQGLNLQPSKLPQALAGGTADPGANPGALQPQSQTPFNAGSQVSEETMAQFLRSFALPNDDPGLAPAMQDGGERDASEGASSDPLAKRAIGPVSGTSLALAARLLLLAAGQQPGET